MTLSKTNGSSKEVDIMVNGRNQIEFLFTEIIVVSSKLGLSQMIKLGEHPVSLLVVVRDIHNVFTHLPTSVTHSRVLNSSFLNKSICISIRFSIGANSP